MDFGAQGLDDTRKQLAELGIGAFGAGTLEENAGNPLILGESGLALLGYACPSTAAVLATEHQPGAAPLAPDRIAVDIAEARKRGARRVVVSLHWGEEEVSLPKPADVKTARAILAAGADLIVGHHSHCIQRFERYQGKFIFYGLGNCIMPDVDEPSYFEETGRSTRRFVKKQQWWNKRSLAVDYDIDSQNVTVRELRFDGTQLRAERPVADRYALRTPDEEKYAASYRRAFAFGKARHKVMSLVSARRTPRPRHLKSLLAIAREVTSPRS
jgi:poly-gamma-glutamate synthesis protein (capsule biosynthesis protein)